VTQTTSTRQDAVAVALKAELLPACSFRWIIVAESTVRWFIVREKHCWMAADLAEPAKRTGW
jgi:hypothetical protein